MDQNNSAETTSETETSGDLAELMTFRINKEIRRLKFKKAKLLRQQKKDLQVQT